MEGIRLRPLFFFVVQMSLNPAWRIIPVSKWLVTMVSCCPLIINGRTSWLINGGYITNYLQVLGAHPPSAKSCVMLAISACAKSCWVKVPQQDGQQKNPRKLEANWWQLVTSYIYMGVEPKTGVPPNPPKSSICS